MAGWLTAATPAEGAQVGGDAVAIPPAWEVLPIPRHADYGSPADFLVPGRVAVVRRENGPYHTRRDARGELTGGSTITEEDLLQILKDQGISAVECVGDDLTNYAAYDTLILLGAPRHNAVTARMFKVMKLTFKHWDDRRTPEDDFTQWSDFGREGYLLKAGRVKKKNIVILAGYDFDDAKGRFYGAGTFYALQSFRQLIVAEGGTTRIKTAEIADKPLIAQRGCYSGFDASEAKQWRDVQVIARIKGNKNVWWYGNSLAGYSVQSSVKFRHPWQPEQLDFFRKIGKYCRERFITLAFCMNPDHYGVEWAAPKSFDGSRKDPLHYDPDYQVDPGYKKMWAALGYEVSSDIDILAAKFGQLHEAVPGCMLQMMNEDDGFGLIHETDQKLFNTKTGDPRQDAINYGKARARLLAALYQKIRRQHPDSSEYMPLIPPGQLGYQLVLDRNEAQSREFLGALSASFKEMGLQDKLPIITTGGGTAAEVVTRETIDNFRRWANDSPVVLHDNNFSGFHVGAYETDPHGPRTIHQINPKYPAGYRDKELYQRVLGIDWNGVPDETMLAWGMSQFMWNMLALDREKITALAIRKVSDARTYPLLKAFYDEFDNPACYLTDNQPPFHLRFISDRIALIGTDQNGWRYDIRFTDDRRIESQRLLRKLDQLIPQLQAQWQNPLERDEAIKIYGHNRQAFLVVYLAYGYLKGWEGASGVDKLGGESLRDLLLEAEDIQQRFFQGPETAPGKIPLVRQFYTSMLHYLYTKGELKASVTPQDAGLYLDLWKEGLQGRFFEPIANVTVASIPDGDPRLQGDWGPRAGTNGELHRTINGQASLQLGLKAASRLLIRLKLGTEAVTLTDSTPISLAVGGAQHREAICKPRWVTWLLSAGANLDRLQFQSAKPVQVHAIEIYQTR